MRRLWRSITATLAAKTVALSVDFLTLLITAHLLGASGRGAIAATLAWAMVFANLFSLSLGQVGARRLMAGQRESLSSVTSALAALAALLTSCAWLAGATFHFVIGASIGGALLAVAMILVPLILVDVYLNHLLSAAGRLSLYNAAQVLGRLAGFAVTLAGLFWFDAGIAAPMAGAFSAYLIVVVLAATSLFQTAGGLPRPTAAVVVPLVRDGALLHLNTVGSFLLFQADVVMLGQMRPLAEAGLYQAAFQLIGVPLLLPTVVTYVLYAELGRRSPDEVWRTQRQLILQISCALVAVAVLGALLAAPIVTGLLGAEFRPAVPAFRILLISMVGMGFSQLMVSQWIARGHFLAAGLLTLSFGVVSVGLNYAFIPAHGYLASAWISAAMFSGSLVGNAIMFWWIDRRIGKVAC